jgi:hypothetical protein
VNSVADFGRYNEAVTVTVVDTGSGGEGEVKGIISNYVAATKRFVVNAVQVDASAASMQGCPATGLANGLLVEIHGVLVSPGLKAQTVQCESESSDATAERQGVVTAVNLSSKTLTLETNTAYGGRHLALRHQEGHAGVWGGQRAGLAAHRDQRRAAGVFDWRGA